MIKIISITLWILIFSVATVGLFYEDPTLLISAGKFLVYGVVIQIILFSIYFISKKIKA